MKERRSARQAAMSLNQRMFVSTALKTTLLIRLLIGLVFLMEQKKSESALNDDSEDN